MSKEASIQISKKYVLLSRLADYAALAKLRLTFLVVISSVAGYFLAPVSFNWLDLLFLVIGGTFITGTSNAINQIIEKDLDAKMNRTSSRPLPSSRISTSEAWVVSLIFGVAGLSILFLLINPLCGWLGALAMLMYTVIYTPMKRMTPLSVLVGAFPGAFPPMMGWVAATGEFGLIPGILFLIQFMWQFPHFWSIAWKLDEDYQRAGFKMLPALNGKSKQSAFQIMVYAMFTIPVGLLPYFLNLSGWIYALVAIAMGLWMFLLATKLYLTLEEKFATKLMFSSFIYLPVVLIAMVLNKLI